MHSASEVDIDNLACFFEFQVTVSKPRVKTFAKTLCLSTNELAQSLYVYLHNLNLLVLEYQIPKSKILAVFRIFTWSFFEVNFLFKEKTKHYYKYFYFSQKEIIIFFSDLDYSFLRWNVWNPINERTLFSYQ